MGGCQPVVEVQVQRIMWSVQLKGGGLARVWGWGEGGGVYVFMDMTSGELGSGTGRGLGLGVKISLEASSSAKAVGAPLRVREGALWAMVCLMPESTRSETFWVGMAEGDMAWSERGWKKGYGR